MGFFEDEWKNGKPVTKDVIKAAKAMFSLGNTEITEEEAIGFLGGSSIFATAPSYDINGKATEREYIGTVFLTTVVRMNGEIRAHYLIENTKKMLNLCKAILEACGEAT